MSTTTPDWERLARRAAAVIGEEEPLRLEFETGRLFVDHAGPALLVHRCGGSDPSTPGASCEAVHHLVTGYPAYLLATGGAEEQEGIRHLARTVASALAEPTGGTLVVEVWSPNTPVTESDVDPFNRDPAFTVYVPDRDRSKSAADVLCDALSGVELDGQGADVHRIDATSTAPPGREPLFEPGDPVAPLGLAVDPVFINTRDREFYPGVLDALRDALTPVFVQTAESFARDLGVVARPLGRRHLEPAAETVDIGLARCAEGYSFLLQVTPINTEEAWESFQLSDFEAAPELRYRPFTFDPDDLRRRLYALPVDAVEDPTVAAVLREKRDEMAVEIQMILDRESDQFLRGSLRLFGAPDTDLVALAENVIDHLSGEPSSPSGEVVGATSFAATAQAELQYYREQSDAFASSVEVREDIPGSLMVAKGQLLVGKTACIAAGRVRALLAHEVGTHVLTYYNGCAQPLRQLRHGLAGYEPLQEGLAVLGEWLVGGLTRARMRTLAARVIAVDALVQGCDFVETFRRLRRQCGLSNRAAFNVCLRVFRSGGLTKDMVYLRGLRDLLAHLAGGGVFWLLFIGKIALSHVPAIERLCRNGVLDGPSLRPRYATDPAALERLEQTRSGLSVLDML
jgi:uncharacterized protein (TIGR02421 family)